MTSLGNNFVQQDSYTGPYMSELLQKHLQQAPSSMPVPAQSQVKPAYTQSPVLQNTNNDTYNNKPLNNNKKAKIAGLSLGAAVIITALSLFAGTKNGKNFSKKASSKLSSAIDDLLHELTKNKTNKSILKKFYSAREKAGSFSNVLENVVNGKDVLQRKAIDKITGKNINPDTATGFKKFYKNTIGKFFSSCYSKYDDVTTALYKKKGLEKLTKLYGNAQSALKQSDDEILKALEELKKSPRAKEKIMYDGVETRIKDIIPDIEKQIKSRQQSFNSAFSKERVTKRVQGFDTYLLGNKKGRSITDKTADGFIKRIKKGEIKELFTEPVARGIIDDKKTAYTGSVRKMKDKISNNLASALDLNRESLASIRNLIKPDDVESIHKYNETMRAVEKYRKSVLKDPDTAREARTSLCVMLDELKKSVKGGSKDSKKAVKTINQFKDSIMNVQSGETEEIMSALEKVLDRETFNNVIKPASKRASSALDKACSMEMYDTLDKLRDINCGSAPTDFQTLIMSAGLLGLYTAQAENNDERVSIGLTTGLPILATVATNLYEAINQVSGKKAMIFGLATGAVTKLICDNLNKMYRKSRGLDENAKASVATIDDYFDRLEPYRNKFETTFINAGPAVNTNNAPAMQPKVL